MIDLVKNCSITSRRIKGSAIRELLKLTQKPEIISFAGGLPATESFPTDDIKEITHKILCEKPNIALQYAPTEGLRELREELVKLMTKEGYNVTVDNILVSTSSQQGLDLVGRVFIDSTDPILVELPTYIGGLQAFSVYGSHFVGVKSDNEGMIIEDLHKKLKILRDTEEHYKFIYTVPDFQNPSGVTWTTDRRKKLIELANQYEILVIDDSPYRELRFEGEMTPTLDSLDKKNNVITLRTFSKILAPGLRLGWIVAHPDIIKKLAVAKQSIDLCASSFNQLIAAEFLKQGILDDHLKKVIKLYKTKRDAMLYALDKYMPKHPEIKWTRPEGGLFMWLSLPTFIDADEMFPEAIEQNVAYVIGSAFHCDGSGQNTMRLNFSFPTVEQIDEGIRRISKVIERRLKK